MQENVKAKTYQQGKKRLFYLTLVFDLGLLLLFQFSGLSLLLKQQTGTWSSNVWVGNGAYVFFFCLGAYLLHFPIDVFSGFIWEHRFHLSNQRFTAWWWDDIKKAVISFLFILVFVEVLYLILRIFPKTWWIGAGIFWLFLSLFLARIMPNVIIPLFYKYRRIDDEILRQRILELFKRCRVTVEDIYAIDFSSKTKKANAFVCGLGKKRRVVLTDNLAGNFEVPEIESVVAHELGHYVGRDIIKIIAVNTAVIFAAFYATDKILTLVLEHAGGLALSDIATLPLFALALMLLGLVTNPLVNAYTRFLESRADRFSLDLTGDADAFIGMMRKLGEMNLAEFAPSRFDEIMFYDHPPIAQRIRAAEIFKEKKAV